MRGGKMHNNWRMAQIHAQEAPDRINELEAWGALFDRTPDGRINQRPFGGHTYSRLAHVGDRTGLEMIRVLQDRAVHAGLDVHMECTIVRLFVVGGRVAGALGYFRETGRFVLFRAGAWVKGDRKKNRRPPELLTRDVVAKAIVREIAEGRGTEHGGVLLDIASKQSPDYIKQKLPSMYHQFKELAHVDITKDAMEIGPTTHYVMGGVKVDAETQESTVSGLFAVGEVGGGMHGANRLGGNSLSDLLVFGRRAGLHAAAKRA